MDIFSGVLTKPDTLQEGEEKGWLDVVEGRKHPLALRYFITKQPAPKDIEDKISHRDARQAERDFFDNHPIWSKCAAEIRTRMGTAHLGLTLSRLLSQLIDRTYAVMICQPLQHIQLVIHSLPKLREEVRTYKATTDSQLHALPPRLAQAPSLELLKLIASYTDKLSSIAQGDKGDGGLLRQCKPAFSNFRAAIRRTAPHFIPTSHAMGIVSDEEPLESNLGLPPASIPAEFVPLPESYSDRYSTTDGAGHPASDVTSEDSEDSDDGGVREPRSRYDTLYHLYIACKIIRLLHWSPDREADTSYIWMTSES